ncbi:MAG: FAD-binding and (Fe-S)-binding domain-containing protein [Anaerolineae bacterium]
MAAVQTLAVEDFARALRPHLQGDVRTDAFNRVLYSTDASNYQVMPLAVVMAESPEDVIAAMETAAAYRLPVLPRGSGTSLAGQAVNEAVIIDLSHLDRILEFDAVAHTVRVQAGTILARLNSAMRQRGLKFGPDPATDNRAVLGGIMGNNSTGAHSILYGMAADHVISMDVVLADGSLATFGPVDPETIARKAAQDTLEGQIYRQIPALVNAYEGAIRERLPRTWRRCGGYNLDRLLTGSTSEIPLAPVRWTDERFNLARLLTGSEGTLGTILNVTVNLVPTPRRTALCVLHFDDLNAALEAVPALLETEPSAIELMDRVQLNLCRDSTAWAPRLSFVSGDPAGILITEYYGENEAELVSKLDRLEAKIRTAALPIGERPRMLDQAAQANVWGVRKAGLGLLMSLRGDAKPVPFIEDVAVPVENLAEYVRDVQTVAAEVDVPLAIYAHASAGCLHIRPILNLKDAQGVANMAHISQAVCDLVLKYRGAWSSEHGDGRARSYLNRHFFGEEVYEAFRKTKAAFDPDGRMNPGNIVDATPLTENLRYGPDYAPIALYEHLDWRADHGFIGAVEMCNGAGVCRKIDGDTMCPSYMVTREEEHSTRGRANLLRAALSGLLPQETLFSDRMAGAMDLCISCKACKSECPSAVDMARIKLEWQAHYHQHHPSSLRTWLFANMPRFSRLGSLLHPLANALLHNRLTTAALDATLGIDRRRTLPRFERAFLSRPPQAAPTGKQVVLYVDTWANFSETSVAKAAFDVLTAAGYEVILPDYACCGRTYLSKGFVKQARAAANRVMAILAPYGRAGIPIVGLEPSCILTVRDEHQYLSDHPDRETVAANTFTFEEFAALHADEWADLFEAESMPCLLHGHCHQKALVGTQPAHAALKLAHGGVQEIDSGCCGMAGAFGYEKEHYAISKEMAFRRLIPTVKGTREDATIVAAGTSCRHQIKDLAGRQALHPAEVLAARLKRDSNGKG